MSIKTSEINIGDLVIINHERPFEDKWTGIVIKKFTREDYSHYDDGYGNIVVNNLFLIEGETYYHILGNFNKKKIHIGEFAGKNVGKIA